VVVEEGGGVAGNSHGDDQLRASTTGVKDGHKGGREWGAGDGSLGGGHNTAHCKGLVDAGHHMNELAEGPSDKEEREDNATLHVHGNVEGEDGELGEANQKDHCRGVLRTQVNDTRGTAFVVVEGLQVRRDDVVELWLSPKEDGGEEHAKDGKDNPSHIREEGQEASEVELGHDLAIDLAHAEEVEGDEPPSEAKEDRVAKIARGNDLQVVREREDGAIVPAVNERQQGSPNQGGNDARGEGLKILEAEAVDALQPEDSREGRAEEGRVSTADA